MTIGVALGTMPPLADEMLDTFVAAGGGTFDTAYVYREGGAEAELGDWLTRRGCRDDCVVVTKGAHPPYCRPERIAGQLTETLGRLRTGHSDVHLLHRDDPSIPVGEWVDALVAEQSAGRIRGYGFSNWTLARVVEATEYAARRGVPAAAMVSNQLSLIRMEQPRWPGCVGADAPYLAWHRASGVPLLAWSSLGGGYLAGLDEEACWRSPGNEERRRRVCSLAQELGVAPTAVGLAWLRGSQPLVIPVIGPADKDELTQTLAGVGLDLDRQRLAWLDLKAPDVPGGAVPRDPTTDLK